MGELLILDLAGLAWVRPDTTGLPPAARSAHTALAYKVPATLLSGIDPNSSSLEAKSAKPISEERARGAAFMPLTPPGGLLCSCDL